MAKSTAEADGIWRFPKLIGAENIKPWERNITVALQSSRLSGYATGTKKQPDDLTENDEKSMTWRDKREYRQEQEEYSELDKACKGRILAMCSDPIRLTIKDEMSAKET